MPVKIMVPLVLFIFPVHLHRHPGPGRGRLDLEVSAMTLSDRSDDRRSISATCCDRGATSVEYALLVSLIAGVVIAAVLALGLAVVPLYVVPWP